MYSLLGNAYCTSNLKRTIIIHFLYNNTMIGYSVRHKEIDIFNSKFKIKANIKIPSNKNSKNGIILAHGGIINRQSLMRNSYSFGDYLCDELDAYVISPDFLGDTVHYSGHRYENFSEIINCTTEYFVENYQLDYVMGFGHSLGCFYLANSLPNNKYLDSVVNYGGPIHELDGNRQKGLISYLINYLSTYNYSINIRNLLKGIFDKETCIYLEDVMMKDKEYRSDNYTFDFNSNMFMYIKELVDNYLKTLNTWGKPVLLLFGSNDGVTRKTTKHYRKNPFNNNNIKIIEIPNASHVTPCMDTHQELIKLEPAVAFFEQMKRASSTKRENVKLVNAKYTRK